MDTSSCVMGVDRFVSRRGTPAMIWLDSGTNFIGEKKELRECMEKWNTLSIASELANRGIKWRFNPPSAPHQVGIWEWLVRRFKRILYTIIGTRRLTDEVLNTTFCLVECALNSRPLTPLSANPSDLGAITPNHFLLGNQATGIPSIVGVDEFNHRKRYARAQSYANAIGLRSTYLRWTVDLIGRHLLSSTSRLVNYFGLLKKATLRVTIQLRVTPTAAPLRLRQRCPLRRRTHVVRIDRPPTC